MDVDASSFAWRPAVLEKNVRMEAVSPLGRTARQIDPRVATHGAAIPAVRPNLPNTPPQSDVLAMAAEIASQSPPIDVARVAALREKISSGDYPINVAATALAIANALAAPGTT